MTTGVVHGCARSGADRIPGCRRGARVDGLVEDATSWTFPIATRRFESVIAVESDHADAHVTFAWKWQPNTAGAALLPDPKRHEAKADFSAGPTGWAMTGLTVDSELD